MVDTNGATSSRTRHWAGQEGARQWRIRRVLQKLQKDRSNQVTEYGRPNVMRRWGPLHMPERHRRDDTSPYRAPGNEVRRDGRMDAVATLFRHRDFLILNDFSGTSASAR